MPIARIMALAAALAVTLPTACHWKFLTPESPQEHNASPKNNNDIIVYTLYIWRWLRRDDVDVVHFLRILYEQV